MTYSNAFEVTQMMFINPGIYAWLVLRREHGCRRLAGTGCRLNLMNIYYYITTYVPNIIWRILNSTTSLTKTDIRCTLGAYKANFNRLTK